MSRHLSRTGLATSLALGALGCASSSPRPEPASAPLEPPLVAQALLGPLEDLQALCAALGHERCEPTTSAIMATPDRYAAQPFGAAGQVGFERAVSWRGSTRHAHLLMTQAGKLWALPAVSAYDPEGGLQGDVSVISFAPLTQGAQIGRLWLSTMLEDRPGGPVEIQEWQIFCRFDPEQAPRCVRIQTVTAKAPSMTSAELTEAGSVFVLYDALERGEARVEIRESMVPTETEPRRAKLLKPGLYPLRFE